MLLKNPIIFFDVFVRIIPNYILIALYATHAIGIPENPTISPPAKPRIDTSGPSNPRV
jgi:hypothetical protein